MTSVLSACAVLSPLAPPAAPRAHAADSCPDVEAIFARGTSEAPDLGPVGEAFTGALRTRLGNKSLNVYPVDYPASQDWPTGEEGVRDASDRVASVVTDCPNTKLVLSGYSQGAAVMGFVTNDSVPTGIDVTTAPKPMPPEIADHVAAVVLFGTPNARAMDFLGQPHLSIGPHYVDKTVQLCVGEDAVCSDGLDFAGHNPDAYAPAVEEGADYAASRL